MAFSTWSTTDKTAGVTLSGSNLIATAGGTANGVRGKDPQRTGKYYFELTGTTWANAATALGVITGTPTLSTASTAITNDFIVLKSGSININGVGFASLGALVSGNIIGIALDLDARLGWMRLCPSGTWNGSATADPAIGSGGISLATAGLGNGFDAYPTALFNATSDSVTANFGGTAFSGTVPSGYTSGWDDTVTPLSNAVVTQQGVEAWATSIPNLNVTQIGIEAFVVPNPAYQITQAGQEVWAVGTGNYQITQVGLEVWGLVSAVSTQYAVTQVGLEVWRSVADDAGTSVTLNGISATGSAGNVSIEIDAETGGITGAAGTGVAASAGVFKGASISLAVTATGFAGNVSIGITHGATTAPRQGVIFGGSNPTFINETGIYQRAVGGGALLDETLLPISSLGVSATANVGNLSIGTGGSRTLVGVGGAASAQNLAVVSAIAIPGVSATGFVGNVSTATGNDVSIDGVASSGVAQNLAVEIDSAIVIPGVSATGLAATIHDKSDLALSGVFASTFAETMDIQVATKIAGVFGTGLLGLLFLSVNAGGIIREVLSVAASDLEVGGAIREGLLVADASLQSSQLTREALSIDPATLLVDQIVREGLLTEHLLVAAMNAAALVREITTISVAALQASTIVREITTLDAQASVISEAVAREVLENSIGDLLAASMAREVLLTDVLSQVVTLTGVSSIGQIGDLALAETSKQPIMMICL